MFKNFIKLLTLTLIISTFIGTIFGQAALSVPPVPNHGPRFGGSEVVLTGTDLGGVLSITIGGVEAIIEDQNANEITITTGNAINASISGRFEIELDNVGTGEYFTYIDPIDIEGIVDDTVTAILGDYVQGDVSGVGAIQFFITAIDGDITATQFNTSAFDDLPDEISDTVGARFLITLPNVAGRTEYAVEYQVVKGGVIVEDNHLTVLALEGECENLVSLIPPLGVEYIGPPSPNVTITYNPATQTFDFDVEIAYLRDNAIVTIDFAEDYEPNTDSIRDVHSTTHCNNRGVLDAASHAFHDLFYSAPVATFPNSLDGSIYQAYPETNVPWLLESDSCDKIRYTANFTFAQLVDCRDMSSSASITVTPGDGTITYSGDLFVDVLQPIDIENENTEFHSSRFRYPFSFQFISTIETINTFTSTQNLVVSVQSATIAPADPRTLTLVLRTTSSVHLTDSTLSYHNVTGLFGSAADLVVVDGNPACDDSVSTCIQTWTFESADPWSNDFNGEYKIQWSHSGDSVIVYTILDIKQVLTETTEEEDLQLAPITLTFHTTELDMEDNTNPKVGAYGNGETIYIRATLDIAGGSSSNFDLQIDDVHICWENNVLFTPSLPEGCLNTFIPDSQRVSLILEGDLTETEPAVRFFADTHLIDDSPAVGVSFAAQPLATSSLVNFDFYIHARITVIQNTVVRRQISSHHIVARASSSEKASLASFTIDAFEENGDGDGGDGGSSASSLSPFNFIL